MPGRTFRRRLAIRFAAWIRWIHIYLSMLGLASVLFFSVTGLTLNHPDWFLGERERREKAEGTMQLNWLGNAESLPTANAPGNSAINQQVSKLEIVEHLRNKHRIHGALAEFRVDEHECLVTFKGPGYAADAFIDRDTGRYDITQTFHGFIAVLNDLHKGRDTGPVWSAVIDVSAIVMTAISLSGLVLLFYLKLRRVPGTVVMAIGIILLVAVCLLWVP